MCCELLEQRMLLSVSASTLAGPLFTPGTSWTYQLTTAAGDKATFTRTVIGPTTFNGVAVTEVDSTIGKASGKNYIGYNAAGDLVQYGQDSFSTLGDDHETYSPYTLFLPMSLTAGVAYTSSSTDTDVYTTPDGTFTDTTVIAVDGSVSLYSETTESVMVPLGTYDAYKFHTSETDTTTNPDDTQTVDVSTTDEWSVDGIGVVRILDNNGNLYELTDFNGQAEHLAFTQQPGDTNKGDPLDPVTVSVQKSTGGVDTDATGSITISLVSIDGNGKLTGTFTKAIVNGIATFDDLKVDAGGTYTLKVVDDAIPPVTSATSDAFDIDVAGLTWTGGGDGVNWSDPKNWDANLKPMNGDTLIFPGGSPLTSNNDMTGLSIASIDIQGSGYTLTGNSISLTTGLTSEADNNTYNIDTVLVGSPAIDDQTGGLTIKSVLSGGGLSIGGSGTIKFEQQGTYTGPTTLLAGVTIDDDVLADAFGTGTITIGAGAKPVTINAGVSGGVATLNNDIIFQDGATLASDPEIVLGGTVTVNGQNFLAPTSDNDQITLNADNIKGTGTLLVKGGGKVLIKGNLAATVQLVVISGELDFDGKLLGAVGGTSQLVMKGGTVKILSIAGGGGLDLISGTFLAPDGGTAFNYNGTITLEQSPTGKPNATIVVQKNSSLGTGQIVVVGPPALTSNVPLIDASSATPGYNVTNDVLLKNGAILNITGAVAFSGTVTMDTDAAAQINTVAKGDTLRLLKGPTTGFVSHARLGLDGPGRVIVQGTVSLGVRLIYGASLTGTTGSIDLFCVLDDTAASISIGVTQVVIQGGTANMVLTDGTGSIDVQGGVLNAGSTATYSGTIYLEQSATGKPGVKLKIADGQSLGTGTIVIASPESGAGNIPVIDATAATSAVTLTNPVELQDGATVNITGNVIFSQAVTASGSSGAVNTLAVADKLVFAGGITNALTSQPTVTLDGPGTITLGGTISFFVLITYGPKLTANTGELDLSCLLDGPSATPVVSIAQVTIEGGKGRIATLSGTGGIDVKGGALIAGAVDGYKGQISLYQTKSGEPSVVLVIGDGPDVSIGTGSLVIMTPEAGTVNAPLIDASFASSGAILDNKFVLDDGSAVTIKGDVTFTAAAIATGAAATVNTSGKVTFNGGLSSLLTNTPIFTLDGSGTFVLGGAISISVTVNYGAALAGSTGKLVLSTDLGGALGNSLVKNDSQVLVQGGTVMMTGVSGDGGIELQGGTLVAGTVSGYDGTITLDESPLGQPPATLKLSDGTSFGSGNLIVATSPTGTGNFPRIDASSATSTVTLDNALVLQDGTTLTVSGNVDFTAAVLATGSTAGVYTIASGNKLGFNGGFTNTVLNSPTITLDGPGTITVGGSVSLGVSLKFGEYLAGLTGLLMLKANLGGPLAQFTFAAGQVTILGGGAKLAGLSGSGGIDVRGGNLQAGDAGSFNGAITLYQADAGKTGATVVIQDNETLGAGTLAVTGPATSTTGVPSIDATKATSGVTLNNTLIMQDGAALTITGTVGFTKAVSVTGATAVIDTLASTDILVFDGGVDTTITGSPILTIDGPGEVRVGGTVATGVAIAYGEKLVGTTGILVLKGTLGSLFDDGGVQILQLGGKVSMFGVSGSGGIDVRSGTLFGIAATGYSGTITLEQSPSGQPGPVVKVFPGGSLGTGLIKVVGPAGLASNVPLIDASGSPDLVTLTNTLYMTASSILNITGNVAFSQSATIAEGTTAEIDTLTSSDTLNFAGGISNVLLLKSVLGLDGPGTTTIGGTVSLGVVVQYGANLAGTNGTLVLSSIMGGILDQVDPIDAVLVLGGKVRLSGLSGPNGIDVRGGTLFAGDAAGYSGAITLEQTAIGLPGVRVVVADGTSLGTGQLVTGTMVVDGNAPLLDAAGLTITLGNSMLLNNGTTLNVTGKVTFGGTFTLATGAKAFLNTVTSDDLLSINGPSTVTEPNALLNLDGPGTINLGGTINETLQLTFGNKLAGSTGLIIISANFGGFIGQFSTDYVQLFLQGGTARLAGISGVGGIDIQAGTLESGSAADYSGTITLERGVTGAALPTIALIAGTTVGTGKISVAGRKDAMVNIPLIDAFHNTLTLGNTLEMQDGATVTITGEVTFAGAVSLIGTTSAINSLLATDILTFNGGFTKSLGGAPTVTLDGPGTFYVGGTVSSGVRLAYGPALTGVTGELVLKGVLGGSGNPNQVIIEGGRARLAGLSGSGGIDIQAGALEGGDASGYSGTITLETRSSGFTGPTITVAEGETLGTGTIVLAGGVLQSTASSLMVLTNVISVTGAATVTATGPRLKFSGGVDVTGTGILDLFGSTAVTGPLTGSGTIILDGEEFDVVGSNPTFTGSIVHDQGAIEVTNDDALGSGSLQEDLQSQGILAAVNSIGDPILHNHLTVESGTLIIIGEFTFPNGITIKPGAVLKLQGTDTKIIVSGALDGGGTIAIDAGTFSATGDTSGFTGNISDQSGKFVPTLTVSDAGGLENGSPFPATYTLTGDGTPPGTTLDGVAATLTYYVGNKVAGQGSATAPSLAGTYTVVATFPGSDNYATVQSDPVTFVITSAQVKTIPTITVSDAGGVANGSPFPATVTLTGTSGSPTATLDGVSPTLTYYVGPTATGTGSAAAPSAAGTYTVVASFAGSENYNAADSSPVTFVISPAPVKTTPTITVTDAGGVANGSPFPATVTLVGTSGSPTATLDGVSPTLTYYVGPTATGTGSAAAPSAAGTYTVVASFAGSANYNAADSSPVTFVISPAQQTGAPTIVAPSLIIVKQNGSIVLSAATGDGISVADTDANGTKDQLTLTVTNGKIKLKSTKGLKFIRSSNNSSSITVVGTLANLNKALNGMTYTPTKNFAGSATLSASIKDATGQSAYASTAIAVNAPDPIVPRVTLKVYPSPAVRGQSIGIDLVTTLLSKLPSGKHVTYQVSLGDGTSIVFVGSLHSIVRHVYKTAGTFDITVTATTEAGVTSAPVTMQIHVVDVAVEKDPHHARTTRLFVGGTPGKDTFVFKQISRNTISVTVNNISEGTFSANGPIIIEGQGGQDVIIADKSLRKRIFFG